MPPSPSDRRTAPRVAARSKSTFRLGQRRVSRSGYGAMQLAGPQAFGAPTDRAAAIGVLRAAVASGVDHIDTAQYYGPAVVNDLIREALHPYPPELAIVSKVAVRRDHTGALVPTTIPTSCARASKTTCAVCTSTSWRRSISACSATAASTRGSMISWARWSKPATKA